MANITEVYTTEFSWSQANLSGSKHRFKYTNTSGSSKKITEVKLYLGTGSGTIYPDTGSTPVVGYGSPITVTAYLITDPSSNSITYGSTSSQSVSSVVSVADAGAPGSSGWFNSPTQLYTFQFSSSPTIANNASIYIRIDVAEGTSNDRLLARARPLPTTLGTITLVDLVVEHKITFHDNGTTWNVIVNSGSSTTLPGATATYSITYTNWGTPITPTNHIRTLNGWYTAETGGTRVGGAGQTYTPTGDIHLYAQYGGANVASLPTPVWSVVLSYDANYVSAPAISPKTINHQFNHWSASGEAITAPLTLTANLHLYAQIYNMPPPSVNEWNLTAIGALPVPTRTGYNFLGWYSATSGGTQITNDTTIINDKTIYAQWQLLCIWKFNGTIWEKIAIPKKFNSTTNQFEEGTVFKRFNSTSWEDLT